jgi:hypothetical protein
VPSVITAGAVVDRGTMSDGHKADVMGILMRGMAEALELQSEIGSGA